MSKPKTASQFKVRELTFEDINSVLGLFNELITYQIPSKKAILNINTAELMLRSILNSNEMVCYVLENTETKNLCGFILGGLKNSYGLFNILENNKNLRIAEIAAWFVSEQHRGTLASIKLFQNFENWAYQNNVDVIVTAAAFGVGADYAVKGGTKMKKFLRCAKYTALEEIYCKVIR